VQLACEGAGHVVGSDDDVAQVEVERADEGAGECAVENGVADDGEAEGKVVAEVADVVEG
jgi:hypothetical protein